MKSSTTWNGGTIAQSTKKNVWVQRHFKYQWYAILMVYSSNDNRCNSSFIHHLLRLIMSTSFSLKTFSHNRSAVFSKIIKMLLMCLGCPDVNKRWGTDTAILRQHPPFMSIKSFVQHSGRQEIVSLCSLIHLIGVCADRDQPEMFSLRLKVPRESHVATAGGFQLIIAHVRLETQYSPIPLSRPPLTPGNQSRSRFRPQILAVVETKFGMHSSFGRVVGHLHLSEPEFYSSEKKVQILVYNSPARPKAILRKEERWLTDVGHNSWRHMKSAQHAAHNPKFEKTGLFRHPRWWCLKDKKTHIPGWW